jgi:hypothetical protein
MRCASTCLLCCYHRRARLSAARSFSDFACCRRAVEGGAKAFLKISKKSQKYLKLLDAVLD